MDWAKRNKLERFFSSLSIECFEADYYRLSQRTIAAHKYPPVHVGDKQNIRCHVSQCPDKTTKAILTDHLFYICHVIAHNYMLSSVKSFSSWAFRIWKWVIEMVGKSQLQTSPKNNFSHKNRLHKSYEFLFAWNKFSHRIFERRKLICSPNFVRQMNSFVCFSRFPNLLSTFYSVASWAI